MLLVFYLLIEHIFAQIGSLELFPTINTIQASTTYELKFQLQQQMPVNSIITIDFTNTNIIVVDGTLTKCTGSIYFTSVSTDYTQCSCTSKKCTIKISQSVASASLYLLKFGQLTNPSFVKPQQVQLTIDFVNNQQTQQYTVDVYQAGDLSLTQLTQSSFKVYDLNDIKLTVQSQHSIEQNGQLIITFPTQIQFSKLSVNVEVNSNNHTGTVSISGQSVTVTNIFSTLIDATTQFIIYLLNVQNQESVRNSNQIIIQTATQYAYLIDSLGFQIQTKTPENIQINFLNTQNTQTVNQIATFQFTLQPVLKFTNGGYLEIKFPSELIIQSNMNCQRIIGLTTVSGTSYSCGYTGQNVRTYNLQYPNSANSMILTVSNIKNPSSTKPTSSFEFRTYDSDGYLMCVSSSEAKFTATNDKLIASVTRTTTTVALQSQYSVFINNTNPVPKNGYLNINIGTQAIKQTIQQLNCYDQSNVQINCQFLTEKTISIQLTSQLAAYTATTIVLQQLNNPNFVITTTSDFQVDTLDDTNYLIDSLQNVEIKPSLTPNTILSIVYYRNNDKLTESSILDIGSITQINLQFQITSQYVITNDGNAIIDLNGYYYLNPDETITCSQIVNSNSYSKNCEILSYVVQTDPKINYISKVKVPNIILNGNNMINIIIAGFRSELYSGQSTHQLTVQVYTLSNQLVSTGYNELGNTKIINKVVQLTQLSIKADSQITGKLTQYTIKHTLKYPIDIKSRNSYLELILPQDLGVDNMNSCLVTINTNTLECVINANKIQIYSNINPYQQDQDLIITLNQIRNPYSTALTSNFQLQYYYNSIVSIQSTQNYQVNQPNQLQVQIDRTVKLVNQNSQFTVSITLVNQVQNLMYQMKLPTDQYIPDQISIKQGDKLLAALLDSSENGVLSIKFKEDLCPCSSGQQLSFSITGFRNPLASSNSVAQLQLLDELNNIYEENKSIQFPPIESGKISITSISQSAQQLNQQNIITISITNDTPYVNSILIIEFNPDNLPFIQNNNIIITLNNNQISCTIDQSKYQITCQNVELKATNTIKLSSINSIKWLKTTNQCLISIYSYVGSQLLDSISQVNCNQLLNFPIQSFDSTIQRSVRILSQNTDLNIQFNHETSKFVTIKIPLTEIVNDPSFNYNEKLILKSQVTTDSKFLILSFQFDNTNNQINFNLLSLQNANAIPQSKVNYIIELSSDGQTVSYQSSNHITPELICQGSQCSDQQLLILSFSKSTSLISSPTDVNINIQLPSELKYLTLLQLQMTETAMTGSSVCYLNNTVVNCQKLLKDQCTLCDQTQILLTLKNLVNADQYNQLEKICVSIQTEFEQISTCSSFQMEYNYLLDVKNINWSQNTFYSKNAQLDFDVLFSSPLNNKYQNYLSFANTNDQIDFSNSKVTFDDTQIRSTYQNNQLNLQICEQGCQQNKNYKVQISQVQFKDYSYSKNDQAIFKLSRADQYLEQSNNIQIYPTTLNMNQITLTATALDYVQLSYSLSSVVPYQSDSTIKFRFQNNNCVSQGKIDSVHNSTCSLKNNAIVQVSLIYNNQITHQSNEKIILTVATENCPTPYLIFQDSCYLKCPSQTYKEDNTCYQCAQENCLQCNKSECSQCKMGYQLKNNVCEQICYIDNCQQCSFSESTQNCISCVTPFELYQNQCRMSNDCSIENCSVCQIKNQQLNCVQCNPDKFKYKTNCLDTCPSGYYDNENKDCVVCSLGCSSCNSQECLECQNQYNLTDKICQCKIEGCQTCNSIDICDKCTEDFGIYFKSKCLKECPSEYYEKNKTCLQCDSECKTCDINGCLSCKENYYLEGSRCILKQCTSNCLSCDNNTTCNECSPGYQIDGNLTCNQIKNQPYFGVASSVLLAILGVAICYQVVSLILPPKLPIFPQVILSSILAFSFLQTIGNCMLLLYAYINKVQIEFILASILFSINNIYYSQTYNSMNNPLLSFITSGTWARLPLLKLKYLSKQNPQQYTNYSLIRQIDKYNHIVTNCLSIIIDVVVISLQNTSEIPYIGCIKLFIDFILVCSFTLEHRLI
ncbi:unnamed protein product (macronuclear) [Paramecium tetraurelia]|uniref:Transmembrane protein n=1 Tax=Paramecium tetraurelia TaxID=5888 RepID=A0DFZ0_PARTE|nr:uncharacterized protein GSPATT00002085001 [Paramecium tetraurelia]CAK81957.1 unnamed protein product [Paramecium tetraurelia]|eukprot:XP_001449354.1 hypothetical protein (macronuclear) [Paramecium tetraurelia strain d4-2]